MIEMTLTECAEKFTQAAIATALNLTHGAITKALNSDRKIIIRVNEIGVIVAGYEIKDFGRIPVVAEGDTCMCGAESN